jgi:hypothetical protein
VEVEKFLLHQADMNSGRSLFRATNY